jgi:beta-phosphoglucomutase
MKQFITAVIFDFNGTLFKDTEFHNKAWSTFAANYNDSLTLEDFKNNIHGHTNKEILNYLFNKELATDLLNRYYEEKEEIYRSICLENPELCILSPGSELFLDYLQERKIKKTIATASYPKNIAFYNSLFNLERWFNIDHIIHDNGKYRGKPFPDMFLAAADILKISITECMIIEDSIMGLSAANNAKAGKIIAISTDNELSKFSHYDFIDQIIIDFRQIDRTCFSH